MFHQVLSQLRCDATSYDLYDARRAVTSNARVLASKCNAHETLKYCRDRFYFVTILRVLLQFRLEFICATAVQLSNGKNDDARGMNPMPMQLR